MSSVHTLADAPLKNNTLTAYHRPPHRHTPLGMPLLPSTVERKAYAVSVHGPSSEDPWDLDTRRGSGNEKTWPACAAVFPPGYGADGDRVVQQVRVVNTSEGLACVARIRGATHRQPMRKAFEEYIGLLGGQIHPSRCRSRLGMDPAHRDARKKDTSANREPIEVYRACLSSRNTIGTAERPVE